MFAFVEARGHYQVSSSVILHMTFFETRSLTEPGTPCCLHCLASVHLSELGLQVRVPQFSLSNDGEDLFQVPSLVLSTLSTPNFYPVPALMLVLPIFKTVSLSEEKLILIMLFEIKPQLR